MILGRDAIGYIVGAHVDARRRPKGGQIPGHGHGACACVSWIVGYEVQGPCPGTVNQLGAMQIPSFRICQGRRVGRLPVQSLTP